jgi:hypothetical protein
MTTSADIGKVAGAGVRRASNRFAWDYALLAERLGPPVKPIIDVHAHVNGPEATRVFDAVRRRFGVERVYSMSQFAQCDAVQQVMGDAVRFTAFPVFSGSDKNAAHRREYLDLLEKYRIRYGSRMLKLWASPRLRDIIPDTAGLPWGATDLIEIDSPWRVKVCQKGVELGMMFMVHIADPDTWFATKYANPGVYGTKAQQYEGLERMLDRFQSPWIAAHMGGWPEDIAFLDGLLSRHPNLHLDTSATKWVVRALGSQPTPAVRAFFRKWTGRILFGSDIVVQDDHLRPSKSGPTPMGDLADSPEAADDLYASRYWALRTMFETDYDDQSPIADPDLKLIDPARHDDDSAPRLGGLSLEPDLLASIYHDAAADLVEAWWSRP